MSNYVSCDVCKGSRQRTEDFRALPVHVKGLGSLQASLHA